LVSASFSGQSERPWIARVIALVVLLAGVVGCDRTKPAHATLDAAASSLPPAAPLDSRIVVETYAMGTLVRVVAWPSREVDEAATRRAIGKALDEFRRVEQLMTPKRADSDQSRVNAHAGEWVVVSEDSWIVVDKALWAGKLSDGAFDITFASMWDVWKFGDSAARDPVVPADKLIVERRKRIDYRKVQLDPATRGVRIPIGYQIGLGGIAKGYGVDKASGVLRAEGVRDFLFQAGGDLFASGAKPGAGGWTTGIQDPRGGLDVTFADLELRDCGLSTAGDYERFYVVDGKRYHHIIDPRTGYPATASRSVSLWAPSAFVSDAIDDAVFILGPEKGLEIVESLPDVGAVIVDAQNKVWVSKRMKDKVRLTRQPTP
jgi:thiamine biosynthesis lipoprotein